MMEFLEVEQYEEYMKHWLVFTYFIICFSLFIGDNNKNGEHSWTADRISHRLQRDRIAFDGTDWEGDREDRERLDGYIFEG